MPEVIIDAIIDSLKIFAAVAVCTYIIAIIEPLFSKKVRLSGKLAPLIGVSVSLLPQCGFSIVAADLYKKRHITFGTLIGVFLATSDEAIPIFLSYPEKALHVLPIIGLKFLIGLIFGYLFDLILVKDRKSVRHHVEHCEDEYKIKLMHCESAELSECPNNKPVCNCSECSASSCERRHAHEHEERLKTGILNEYFAKYSAKQEKKKKIDRFLIKPLFHSLEIFFFALVVNIIFGIAIYYIGEEKLVGFLLSNKYLAPLLAVIVGAIPNCVSSILLSELYIMGGLGFGAALGGLCMNSGLAFIYIFKSSKSAKKSQTIKNGATVIATMFLISLFIGYIFSLIFDFSVLPF